MYHFHHDEEGLAWRVSGLASRQCLELGLHRRDTYATLFPNPEDQASAIRMFWTVYVLDRRWSFGTGMPFALQDADIDNVPKPVSHAQLSVCISESDPARSHHLKSLANISTQ